MKRVCPACARRTAELVDPDCSVCCGDGFLVLHPAALTLYEPAVVAEAIALALESMARLIDGATTLSDDRRAALGGKVRDLVTARIIQQPGKAVQAITPAPQPAARPRRKRRHTVAANQLSFSADPEIVAEAATQIPTKPYDGAVIAAAPHRYQSDDRPLMRGLPVLSADGHPSHLARIEDPQDAYASTGQECADRARRTRQATIVVASMALVVAERVKTA